MESEENRFMEYKIFTPENKKVIHKYLNDSSIPLPDIGR